MHFVLIIIPPFTQQCIFQLQQVEMPGKALHMCTCGLTCQCSQQNCMVVVGIQLSCCMPHSIQGVVSCNGGEIQLIKAEHEAMLDKTEINIIIQMCVDDMCKTRINAQLRLNLVTRKIPRWLRYVEHTNGTNWIKPCTMMNAGEADRKHTKKIW